MNTNLFSYEDLSAVVKKLLEVDQQLDQLLSEYQTSDRREQIEQMKMLSEPINLLLPLSACLNEDSGVIEVDQDLRSVELKEEFFKVETWDWKIDSWLGESNSNPYADKPHPWLGDDSLKQYPAELAEAFESILSSYFSLTGIECSRREAWTFWSKTIFDGVPGSDDNERWESMQRAYFNCQEKRREFLNNLLSAIRNPASEEADSASQASTAATESSVYGFVYFILNGDLCKIGITENLLRRMEQLKPDEILNVVRCQNFVDLERDLHSRFKEERLPQTEYFRLSADQIRQVNKLMPELAIF